MDKSIPFSILIPTWNNFPYLKCCIESIRKNSSALHEIIVHVNEGKDQTIEFLEENNILYTISTENIGICNALNSAFKLSTLDYIVYMNDDMYVLPGWDIEMTREIKSIGHEQFYLSATMIEPRHTGNPCVLAPYNFGESIESFDEIGILQSFEKFHMNDWSGATWPPSLVHRSLWEKIGGYSEEFSPGLYSDPDFSMKLWHEGVRIFKGIGKSKVYHFQSKSLGKVKLNDGRRQFAKKWGITASYFKNHFLKLGKSFSGELKPVPKGILYQLNRFKAKLL